MSRICFVCVGNLYNVPYIKAYEDILEEDFDIIYWNRDCTEEYSHAKNLYQFKYRFTNTKKKLIGYYKFTKFTFNILEKNNYEIIIFLSSLSAVLNYKVFKKKNSNFIVDVRDYTLENNILFYWLERKCFEKCKAIVISSPAYKSFLPKNINYLVIHNTQDEHYKIHKRKKNKSLTISFIGTVNYLEMNKKVIDYFANDDRFLLKFIGKNSEILNKYCLDHKIKNVYFGKRFNPDDISYLYEDTDIILNAYGNNTPKLDFALSNKLYFATNLKIPIIVNDKTYMQKVTTDLGIGFIFDNNPNLKNELLEFELTEEIIEKLDKFNENVKKTNIDSLNEIRRIINKGVWYD